MGVPSRMIQLPLWSRWILAVLGFALLGLLVFVLTHGHDSTAPTSDALGTVEANRVGQIVVSQDQAPRQARLPRGASSRAALEHAITVDVDGRIASHDLTGPLTRVSCTRTSPHASRRRDRLPYVCTVTSASILYVFYGVADLRARTLTWCKQDAVAEAGLTVSLSPSCLS